jgi:hypothetical protein
MTAADDLPPAPVELIFRVLPLRRQRRRRLRHIPICPAEDGPPRRTPVTCTRCGLCWTTLPDDAPARLPLPVLPADS